MSTSPKNQQQLLWDAKPAARPDPKPGEPLWSVTLKNGVRFDCELHDHRQWGVEVQIFRTYHERDFYYGRRWPTRELALLEAEELRADCEKHGWILTVEHP